MISRNSFKLNLHKGREGYRLEKLFSEKAAKNPESPIEVYTNRMRTFKTDKLRTYKFLTRKLKNEHKRNILDILLLK